MIQRITVCPTCKTQNRPHRKKCKSCGFNLAGVPSVTKIRQTDNLTSGQKMLVKFAPAIIFAWRAFIYSMLLLAVIASVVFVQPNYPIPKVSRLKAEAFMNKINMLRDGKILKTRISNTELNSFFYHKMKDFLEVNQQRFGPAQSLTITAIYTQGDKIQILLSKKFLGFPQYLNITGRIVFRQGRMMFNVTQLHYGYLRLPRKVLKSMLHPVERILLTHTRVPAFISKVYAQNSHLIIESNPLGIPRTQR